MSTVGLQAMRRIPLFAGLDDRELGVVLQVLGRKRLEPGEVLFREGEPAPSGFVVANGTLQVLRTLPGGGQQVLAELGAGALVGHVALIDHRSRSATVRAAAQPVWLLELGRTEFDRLFLGKSPFAYKLLDQAVIDLSARLREATAKLVAAHRAPDVTGRRELAHLAAQALESYRHDGSSDFPTDIDLDQIEFEVPEQIRLQRYGKPGRSSR
jgi:CRP-like cAMP-binding protein